MLTYIRVLSFYISPNDYVQFVFYAKKPCLDHWFPFALLAFLIQERFISFPKGQSHLTLKRCYTIVNVFGLFKHGRPKHIVVTPDFAILIHHFDIDKTKASLYNSSGDEFRRAFHFEEVKVKLMKTMMIHRQQ